MTNSVTPDPASCPTFEFSRVQGLADGDLDFVREVYQTFLRDTAERMGQLTAALSAGDSETLRLEGHSVKGAAGNVGASRLFALARDLEAAERAGDQDTVTASVVDMQEEFARVRVTLEAYLSSTV